MLALCDCLYDFVIKHEGVDGLRVKPTLALTFDPQPSPLAAFLTGSSCFSCIHNRPTLFPLVAVDSPVVIFVGGGWGQANVSFGSHVRNYNIWAESVQRIIIQGMDNIALCYPCSFIWN